MNDTETKQTPVERLYSLAEPQAGYFTTIQAKATGFSQRQLTYYVRSGRFLRIKRGVYRLVLYPSTPYEDLYIAWLETGPGTVISHESALTLYDLSDVLPASVHLIVPRSASRRHKWLSLHTNQLDPQDVTRMAGLPVTTVSRTIADVAANGLAEDQVIQAVKQAIQRGLVSQIVLQNDALNRGGRFLRLVSLAIQDLAI